MRRRFWLAAITSAAFLLTACGGGGALREPAYFDLGGVAAKRATTIAIPLRGIDVQAPSWLAGASMQYRLSYADGARRQAYSESRWVAPPAELLESSLRRGMATDRIESGVATGVAGCQLKLDLDEFIQVFESPNESRAVIEGRVMLLAAQGNSVVARRVLTLSKPAATADARGGVAAFAMLGNDAVNEITAWLNQLAKDSPKQIERCRAG
jgi:cholesterol transport system auxiliary component